MSDRLKAMRRIMAVQAQAKRLAEWELAATERRKAAIEAARRDLDSFVEGANLAGPLGTIAIKQARRLAQREAASEQDRSRQIDAVQAAERRHRLSERVTETLATEERAAEERRLLEQLVEGLMARGAPRD
ncbi:hypothetical protein [Lichenifustis flavocetrariae]|uniref:Flagellar FliJ protein n=1 Tax=Lichenifustis flavocetrariae TaxID=2949735 RepID=A0AA41YYV0_9HYPH|nr:hypothetical protein [Lichenifustis flavocetrariae]MCW6507345.1 hypothetical protein [Lichenifustis flavocetrariae]